MALDKNIWVPVLMVPLPKRQKAQEKKRKQEKKLFKWYCSCGFQLREHPINNVHAGISEKGITRL